MSDLTNYLEDALLNHVFRNTALASPAAVYVALFTAAPGEAGGGTEVAGGAYARQACGFGAPASNKISNAGTITFPTATADWGTITHVAIFDANAGGNMLAYKALAASKTVNTGDVFEFAATKLSVELQ